MEKIFNFSTRDSDHLHACASRVYGAILSKNRFFGTTHGDKPVSQNGISLRSPSLIMAPDLICYVSRRVKLWRGGRDAGRCAGQVRERCGKGAREMWEKFGRDAQEARESVLESCCGLAWR